ncbi:hypothetical protein OBBRIDRAFT_629684 [Obba rivulosa]|uniref:Uncharacterized protein n=1 Tax=Obba rivulosa TaxID=1052685 RepID=A0A8E2DK44_9APHY|nr:hypothetical protein OBBRIDRAFT_629684 [Obba rivulosa]
MIHFDNVRVARIIHVVIKVGTAHTSAYSTLPLSEPDTVSGSRLGRKPYSTWLLSVDIDIQHSIFSALDRTNAVGGGLLAANNVPGAVRAVSHSRANEDINSEQTAVIVQDHTSTTQLHRVHQRSQAQVLSAINRTDFSLVARCWLPTSHRIVCPEQSRNFELQSKRKHR